MVQPRRAAGLQVPGGDRQQFPTCAADLCRGEFPVGDEDHRRTVWHVRGPAKDLVLTTDYAREG